MSVIPIEDAIAHLRAEIEDQGDIQKKLDGAEEKAMAYLQRRFYADGAALDIAKATITQRVIDSRNAYEEAKKQAENVVNADDKQLLIKYADEQLKETRKQIRMIANGMVINDSIKVGVLLILGDIYENRGDYQQQNSYNNIVIPEVSVYWLIDYRVDMGV